MDSDERRASTHVRCVRAGSVRCVNGNFQAAIRVSVAEFLALRDDGATGPRQVAVGAIDGHAEWYNYRIRIHQRLISLGRRQGVEPPPRSTAARHHHGPGNQITVHLTDGSSHGPFTLPTAQWRWTGSWRTSTVYFVNDIFSFDGAIYRVAVSHTSDATVFDRNALSSPGYVYKATWCARAPPGRQQRTSVRPPKTEARRPPIVVERKAVLPRVFRLVRDAEKMAEVCAFIAR
jgi:hypothetical protein